MKLTTAENLREELKKNVVKFKFLKKNGVDERLAFGTLREDFIPLEKRSKTLKANTFFDIEKQNWRSMSNGASFYIDKILEINVKN